jgi:hypothetical protein
MVAGGGRLGSLSNGSSSPASGSGTAKFSLTDAPSCGDFTSAVVKVIGVELIGSGGTSYTLTLSKPLTQDLLQLTNGSTVPLGPIKVPAGTYSQIRLILAPTKSTDSSPANYVTTSAGGTAQYALTTPSAQQSGYKVKGDFVVDPGNTVDVTLDFNACRSIVTAGKSGKYLLKPVITATPTTTTGIITGIAAAGAVVYAEDADGHIIKSTVADSTGSFTLSPLEATDAGYNVVVASPQPPSGTATPVAVATPSVVLNVPVTAGQGTVLSDLPAEVDIDGQTDSGNITVKSADTSVLVLAQEPVANPSDSSSPYTVTIAESLASAPTAITTDNVTTYSSTYSLTFSTQAPNVATYASAGLSFSADSALPPITVSGFGSDGSTGSAPSTTPYDFTLSGSGDNTYTLDN